jgi:hypothetical protein
MTTRLDPVPSDLRRKAEQLLLKHGHSTASSLSFSFHKILTQSQDVTDQHLHAAPIGKAQALDILDFAEQPSSPQFPDMSDVGNQQALPRSTRRVTAVEPGEPFDKLRKGSPETPSDYFRAYVLSVVAPKWLRLGDLLHSIFSSSSVIPRIITAFIYFATNCIDIMTPQRDDSFIIKRSLDNEQA